MTKLQQRNTLILPPHKEGNGNGNGKLFFTIYSNTKQHDKNTRKTFCCSLNQNFSFLQQLTEKIYILIRCMT